MNIFISYRRSDTSHAVKLTHQKLREQFPDGKIFRDIDSIPAGTDFKRRITDAIVECHVVLAMIGERWFDENELDPNKTDFVKLELKCARKNGLIIIPVLIGDMTRLPNREDLPRDLRWVLALQLSRLRDDPDWDIDMNRLVNELKKIEAAASSNKPLLAVTEIKEKKNDASRNLEIIRVDEAKNEQLKVLQITRQPDNIDRQSGNNEKVNEFKGFDNEAIMKCAKELGSLNTYFKAIEIFDRSGRNRFQFEGFHYFYITFIKDYLVSKRRITLLQLEVYRLTVTTVSECMNNFDVSSATDALCLVLENKVILGQEITINQELAIIQKDNKEVAIKANFEGRIVDAACSSKYFLRSTDCIFLYSSNEVDSLCYIVINIIKRYSEQNSHSDFLTLINEIEYFLPRHEINKFLANKGTSLRIEEDEVIIFLDVAEAGMVTKNGLTRYVLLTNFRLILLERESFTPMLEINLLKHFLFFKASDDIILIKAYTNKITKAFGIQAELLYNCFQLPSGSPKLFISMWQKLLNSLNRNLDYEIQN
jgi:hypothetical protein